MAGTEQLRGLLQEIDFVFERSCGSPDLVVGFARVRKGEAAVVFIVEANDLRH